MTDDAANKQGLTLGVDRRETTCPMSGGAINLLGFRFLYGLAQPMPLVGAYRSLVHFIHFLVELPNVHTISLAAYFEIAHCPAGR